MQQSQMMSKIGPVRTFVQFVWALRRIVAVILLALTLIYLLFSETLEQRRFMLGEFSKAQEEISALEAAVKKQGDAVFREPSRSGRSVSSLHAENLYRSAQALHSALLAMSPPNRTIEATRNEYARSVAKLLGTINLFEEGEEGTISVLQALVEIEIPAANFREAAEKYQNSVWVSFWAAL